MPIIESHKPSFSQRKRHVAQSTRLGKWSPHQSTKTGYFARQHHYPQKDVSREIGFKPGQKILIVAGYYGDWAAHFAKNHKVTYTDVGREMAEYAKKSALFRGTPAKMYKAIPAELVPQRQKIYDWTFSFEPYPISKEGGMQHTLVRSLLNNKGSKFLFVDDPYKPTASYFTGSGIKQHTLTYMSRHYFNPLQRIYGAKVSTKVLDIKLMAERLDKPQSFDCTLYTVETNNLARQRAKIDLIVARIIEKNPQISAEEIARILKRRVLRINESLQRIKLLDQIQKERDKLGE